MTFTSFGLRAFEVQYWDGAAWVTVPGAAVTNNNLVWRRFTFAPVTTTKIRVHITGALNGYARSMEVEAWGVPGGQARHRLGHRSEGRKVKGKLGGFQGSSPSEPSTYL